MPTWPRSRQDLIGDPRYASGRARIANSDFLYREVREILGDRGTAEWLELCARHGIPATAIARLDDIVDALPEAVHPVAGRHKVVPPPARFSLTPSSVRRPAPLIGEHNHEVLTELGLTAAEISHLEAAGVLRNRGAGGAPSAADR